jgi:hypothetical protein
LIENSESTPDPILESFLHIIAEARDGSTFQIFAQPKNISLQRKQFSKVSFRIIA